MNRVTPEQVLEAYKRTHLEPTNEMWFYISGDGRECGCALTAVAISQGKLYEDEIDSDFTSRDMAEALDLPVPYINGFTSGFTCSVYYNTYKDEVDHMYYKQGFEDGEKAWRTVAKYFFGSVV